MGTSYDPHNSPIYPLLLADAHAERLPRERLRCVLGMFSSLEVQVLRPT